MAKLHSASPRAIFAILTTTLMKFIPNFTPSHAITYTNYIRVHRHMSHIMYIKARQSINKKSHSSNITINQGLSTMAHISVLVAVVSMLVIINVSAEKQQEVKEMAQGTVQYIYTHFLTLRCFRLVGDTHQRITCRRS